MAQVVRREVGHAGRGTGAGDRRPEALATEALVDRPLGDAIRARHEPRDGLEERGRNRNPARAQDLEALGRDGGCDELSRLTHE
jgi:hypothetical protein